MVSFLLCIGTPDAIFTYMTAPVAAANIQEREGGVRCVSCYLATGPVLMPPPVPGSWEASLYFNGELWLEPIALESTSGVVLTFGRRLLVWQQYRRAPLMFTWRDVPEEKWNILRATVLRI